MCGRYSQSKQLDDLISRFCFRKPAFELRPRYNIAPSQDAPVILPEGDDAELVMMRWGLIPSWTKELSGDGIINARAETVADKPSFRNSFKKRRCLVVADGFYEWKAIPGIKRKIPMRIRLKSDEPFAMAGLWDIWKTPEGKELRTFAILTTAPNRDMEPIHNRMPVILSRESEKIWLNPKQDDPAKLTPLLSPSPDGQLETYKVSTAVNSPANDKPECLVPAN